MIYMCHCIGNMALEMIVMQPLMLRYAYLNSIEELSYIWTYSHMLVKLIYINTSVCI